ncbi:hypothetical protein [Serratia ureilytica]|uniref:hypothetical protein n=1 Tax=Serratia ureilytica TaxID=300181 RepID=UPI0018D5F094|nr:hypothetical protein [Serratia ureilytica]MBH3122437.1 hypothetical protein [Serratia ureilytica]
MTPSELMYQFGRPVAYYPGLVPYLGSVKAVLMFCQFFYWQERTESEIGVYKSSADIELETGLSYREQVTARNHLVSIGVLHETNKRVEHRIYYRIDSERLNEIITRGTDEKRNSRNDKSAVRELTKAQFGKQQKRSSGTDKSAVRGHTKSQFVPTEITTKTTTEITTETRARNTAKKTALDFSQFPTQPSPDVWADYVQHRKAKRAPISQTVLNLLAKELAIAVNAGWTVDGALAEAMAAGWQGLKAEWLLNRNGNPNGRAPPVRLNRQEALEARNAQIIDDFVDEYARGGEPW